MSFDANPLLHKKSGICVSSSNNSIGIDLVHVKDMEAFLEDSVDLILTEKEWAEVKTSINVLERLAGKFAAKEAVMKVLTHGIKDIPFTDIEILSNSLGAPMVYLYESSLFYWNQKGYSHLDISISHHNNYAVAVARTQ